MKTKETEELIRKFRELCKVPSIIQAGTVKAETVDLVKLTCTVILLDETEIPGVRLKASVEDLHDGIVQIPSDGTTVLVAMIGNRMETRFVIAFSQVEKVIMFKGENGGIVNVEALVAKLNALEQAVNQLRDHAASHVHSAHNTASATPLAGDDLSETERSEIEDDKVLH